MPWFRYIAAAIAGNLYAEYYGPRRYSRIVSSMSSQIAKSEICFNVIGHKLHDDPQPIIYLGPTKSNVDGVAEPRIEKMLQGCAYLWARTRKGRRAQKLIKRVNGVELRLGWAGSASEVASMPAGLLVLDEVDRMETIKGEGDPVSLSEARLSTYPGGQQLLNSSPTLGTVETEFHPVTGIEHWKLADPDDIESPIWLLWQTGTRFEWAVKCQGCARYFVPRFRLLTWGGAKTPQDARARAGLNCPRDGCGFIHTEALKETLNMSGRFLAPGMDVNKDGHVTGEPPESDLASFWISGLMSPWVSFGKRAYSWLEAVASKDQAVIQAQLNTSFGELYSVRPPEKDWREMAEKVAGDYKQGDFPPRIQHIYITVDVQKDRLMYVVRGWGYGFESWKLEHGELWGETDQPQVWADLKRMLSRSWGGHGVTAVAIDSGYRPDPVYDFCREHDSIAYATKGDTKTPRPYRMSLIDVTESGRVMRSGVKLWMINTDIFKGWVHDRLAWDRDAAHRWQIPKMSDVVDATHNATEFYCRQILGEEKIQRASGGHVWIRRSENHFLDCEALQIFLANVKGVRDLEDLQPETIRNSGLYTSAEVAGGSDFVLVRRESEYLSGGGRL